MLRIFVLVAVLCAPSFSAASTLNRFSDIVVFGDSLSDPFNPFLPPTFYPNQQVTNGDTWAVQLGLDDPAADNFAKSSATAKDNFQQQIDAFTALGTVLGDNALAMIWLGGNDIGDAVLNATGLPRINEALGAMTSGINNLAKAGFDKALVFLAPDIGDTPRVQNADALFPGTAAAATALTGAYNLGLINISATLTEDITLGFVDIPGLLGAVQVDPATFGFTNIDDACVIAFSFYAPNCDETKADGFLYYDDFHPTERAHSLISDAALAGASAIAPVPLPAGMMLMISALGALGLGVLGWQRRRVAA